jgi:hypothetical protein
MELNAGRCAPVRIVTQLNARWEHFRIRRGSLRNRVGGEHGGESSWSRITGDPESVRAQPWLIAALDAGGDRGVA